MNEKKCVLAQYTIRSKQEYIYKTNRILEIVGASEIISKAWDEFFKEAESIGLKISRAADGKEFNFDEVCIAFENGSLHLSELYRGGGNLTVLFASREEYIRLNSAFSFYMLTNHPGIIPMAVCTEVSGNYKDDYRVLMGIADNKKNVMYPGRDYYVAPFAMVDRNTFLPFGEEEYIDGKLHRYSEESFGKRKIGMEVRNADDTVKMLDDMVTCHGEESLLAVVHADGNNMGAKIIDLLHDKDDYTSCINLMRAFAEDTNNAFVTYGKKCLEDTQKRLMENIGVDISNEKARRPFMYRIIVADGDDMTFICNARYVMDYVKAYLKAVSEYKDKHNSNWEYSSCAGICIFHSHYPFAKAYKLAEQACDNAKVKVHCTDKNDSVIEEGWVDFHYIHSGVNENLDDIRNIQGTDKLMARPWRVTGVEENIFDYWRLEEIASVIKDHGARTNIKTIGAVMEDSMEQAKSELVRVYGHNKKLKSEFERIVPESDELMKVIYDVAEIYDLWIEGGR